MEPLNVEKDFLESLQYSAFRLPEILHYLQKRSGWSKKAYLEAMKTEVLRRKLELNQLIRKAKAEDPSVDEAQIAKSLEEATSGKVKEYFDMKEHDNSRVLNTNVLDTYSFFLKKAWSFGEAEPVYSNLQIISFAIKAVEFIYNELQIQAGLKDVEPFYRTAPKDFKPITEDGKPMYLIHNYLVLEPTPVFDYYLFEDRLRDLLLNSQHPERLSRIVSPLFDLGKKIVTVWNEKLAPLSDFNSKENVKRTKRAISFNTEKRDFTIYHDLHSFVYNQHKGISNYELTVYAASVGHLVAEEVLEIKDETDNSFEVKKHKPAVASYALKHIYWSKYDATKAITKTNKKSIADGYGISENTFFTHYNKYYEKANRLSLSGEKKEQKNSVQPFIQKFEDAASMLETVCKPAYDDIVNDITFLKTKYETFLD